MKFKYYFFLLLHLIIIAFVWLSSIFLRWQVVVLGCVAYPFLPIFFRGCPVTIWQFGNNKFGFYEYYFKRLGLKVSKKMAVFIPRYLFPFLISVLSIYVQIFLGIKPLLF